MSWVATAIVGSALVGKIGADKKMAREDAYNDTQAKMSKYSPWTGLQPQMKMGTADPFGQALAGGLAGAGMAQQFKTPSVSQAPIGENISGAAGVADSYQMPVMGQRYGR